MMLRGLQTIAAAAAVTVGALAVLAAPGALAQDADEVETLVWEDLLPDGEVERLETLYNAYFTQLYSSLSEPIQEGSEADTMMQLGTFNVVEDLDGLRVRLPGYVVPFDYSSESEVSEFLLVPYFGACIHTPPPPPNQIVYVTAETPAEIEDIWRPVWVEGVMSTGRYENEMGDAAYTLALSAIEPYQN